MGFLVCFVAFYSQNHPFILELFLFEHLAQWHHSVSLCQYNIVKLWTPQILFRLCSDFFFGFCSFGVFCLGLHRTLMNPDGNNFVMFGLVCLVKFLVWAQPLLMLLGPNNESWLHRNAAWKCWLNAVAAFIEGHSGSVCELLLQQKTTKPYS